MLYFSVDMSRFQPSSLLPLPGGRPSCRRAAWLGSILALLVTPAWLAAQNAPPQKSGFPLTFAESPTNQVSPIGSQVIAADLGLTPGFKSIIFGLRNGKLYVVQHNANGTWGV